FKCSNVRSQTTKNVIDALEKRSLTTRLWVISSAGSNESMEQLGFFSRTFVKNILIGHISDHSSQEKYVLASSLPYTIVRPTGLKEEGMVSDHNYMVLDQGKVPTNTIRRGDLAHFIVTNIANKQYIGKAVIVTSKPTSE